LSLAAFIDGGFSADAIMVLSEPVAA